MPNPVVHFEIQSNGPSKLHEFYTGLLIPVIQSTLTLPSGLPA